MEMTPFEADLGYVPQMPLDVIATTTSINFYCQAGSRTRGHQAVSFTTTMADILAHLQDTLAIAQANQDAEANKKQQPHNFQSDDPVMINTRNMPLRYGAAAPGTNPDTNQSAAQCSRALQQRYVGPYTPSMQFHNGNAFDIADRPEHLRIHKTFNVSEFKRCTIDESRPQESPPPIKVTMSSDAEYDLQAIREWRVKKGMTEFQVKWEGQSEEECRWEPLTNLTSFRGKEKVREYVVTMNDEDWNKLIPKNLYPADHSRPPMSATTRPQAAKIIGLPPTRRSARVAAMQD
jgi:hypothetical protein